MINLFEYSEKILSIQSWSQPHLSASLPASGMLGNRVLLQDAAGRPTSWLEGRSPKLWRPLFQGLPNTKQFHLICEMLYLLLERFNSSHTCFDGDEVSVQSALFSGQCTDVVMFSLVESLQTLSQFGLSPLLFSSLSLAGPWQPVSTTHT